MRCYLEPEAWPEGACPELSPQETHHALRVLRCREGDRLVIFDGRGREAEARVAAVSGSSLRLAIEGTRLLPPPAVDLVLYQAVLREQKMDWVLQKGVELGVGRIVPVQTRNAVARVRREQADRRLQRWRTIVLNAGKQCGTAWLPAVTAPVSVEEAAREGAGLDALLLADLEASRGLGSMAELRLDAVRRIGVAIGPEGDFTQGEKECFRAAGAVSVALGPRTLRAETAALYALSVLGALREPGPARPAASAAPRPDLPADG